MNNSNRVYQHQQHSSTRNERHTNQGQPRKSGQSSKRHYVESVEQASMKRSKRPEANNPSLILMDRNSALEKMTETISKCFQHNRQDETTYNLKIKLVDRLYTSLNSEYPNCGLYLVGSSVNGFGEKTSDVDLCLVLSEQEITRADALNVLQRSRKIISRLRSISRPTLIRATIPILDFYDNVSQKECDMNVNNITGIRNSHLLNLYAKYDYRVRPLVTFVKRWARFQNINSAKDSTLSSYVLTLMVIHYLQYGVQGPPVLPCLQKEYPDVFAQPVRNIRMDLVIQPRPGSETNALSLAELLIGFFGYYTLTYKFERDVASIRAGGILDLSGCVNRDRYCQSQTQRPSSTWTRCCMYIEEPFSLTNAARNVFQEYAFTRIKRIIRKSHMVLQQTLDANSIVKDPF